MSILSSPWVTAFCSEKENKIFCHVPLSFINDDNNLIGLDELTPFYDECLAVLRSRQVDFDAVKAARNVVLLYGLIHARFIITPLGLELMLSKFLRQECGVCGRKNCFGAPLLPMGESGRPFVGPLRWYCCICKEIYNFNHQISSNFDGSAFGPHFVPLFLMTYETMLAAQFNRINSRQIVYVPRIFGFKLASSSRFDVANGEKSLGRRDLVIRQDPRTGQLISDMANDSSRSDYASSDSENESDAPFESDKSQKLMNCVSSFLARVTNDQRSTSDLPRKRMFVQSDNADGIYGSTAKLKFAFQESTYGDSRSEGTTDDSFKMST